MFEADHRVDGVKSGDYKPGTSSQAENSARLKEKAKNDENQGDNRGDQFPPREFLAG